MSNEATSSNKLVWLYQTYYRAKYMAEGFAGIMGHGSNHIKRGEPVSIFDKEFVFESEESDDYKEFLTTFKRIIWLTYRRAFVAMPPPNSYTTDTGWGCMLRSAQMLLARVLVKRFNSDDCERHFPVASRQHQELIRMFLDVPKYFAHYSIHRMVEYGRQHNMKPGQWYGPTTVALIVKDLVEAHEALHAEQHDSTLFEKLQYPVKLNQGMAVLVTDDGTIYLDEVVQRCGGGHMIVNMDMDSTGSDPMLNPDLIEWKNSLFLVIPIRLGLNAINEDYVKPLLEILKLPQCTGMIGGRPGHSLYFVGSQEESLLYLDPHVVQRAASNEDITEDGLPDQELVATYHCSIPRLVPASAIDPSLAIGFWCPNRSSFMHLVAKLGQVKSMGSPLIGYMQSRPKYDDLDVDLETEHRKQYNHRRKSSKLDHQEEGEGVDHHDEEEEENMDTASEGSYDDQDFVLI